MVAAAKLKGDETRLKLAKPFNTWTTALREEPKLCEDATFEELPQKCLIVPFTSERVCVVVSTPLFLNLPRDA